MSTKSVWLTFLTLPGTLTVSPPAQRPSTPLEEDLVGPTEVVPGYSRPGRGDALEVAGAGDGRPGTAPWPWGWGSKPTTRRPGNHYPGERGHRDRCLADNALLVLAPRSTDRARRLGEAVQHRRPFRRLVKWRTGSEGRISTLKRGYGWDRSQLDGIHGARIWCGHGVFAHNLVKISALTT
jgi:IS5 family transposase